jgi:AcrR family transcriptional regulator
VNTVGKYKGKTEQGSVARERLLAAALKLFTTMGYAATSVREIVTAAELSKPSLYYYFGSKEGIYLELMQNTYATFTERSSVLKNFRGTCEDRIVNFCTGIFDAFLEHMDEARIIYSIYFGPPQGAPPFPLDRYFEDMLEIIRSMLLEGITTGELRKVDETDAAWIIISGMNSAMEEQICHTPPRIDREGLVRMLDLFFCGITCNERSSLS